MTFDVLITDPSRQHPIALEQHPVPIHARKMIEKFKKRIERLFFKHGALFAEFIFVDQHGTIKVSGRTVCTQRELLERSCL